MGSIIGDFFKQLGKGIDKITDGQILSGLDEMISAPGAAIGRTIDGALGLVGLGGEKLEPGTRLLLCEIALLAKMAKADGRVDKSEIAVATSIFDALGLDDEARKTLQRFFNDQKKNVSDAAEWANGLREAAAEMDPDDEDGGFELRLDAYRKLFAMALADGELDEREIALLRALTDPLGFKPEAFDVVAAEWADNTSEDDEEAALGAAYATLGVSQDASEAEIRAAYKRKIAVFHPDKIQSKALDPEWVELANQKSAEINRAYETIKNARARSGTGTGETGGRQTRTQAAPSSAPATADDGLFRLAENIPATEEANAVLALFRRAYERLKRDVYPEVGVPGAVFRNPDGGWQSNLENWAAITLRPGASEAFEVHGAICAKWYVLGGAFDENGRPGTLGYPLSNERAYRSMGRASDRISYFEHGDIAWNSAKHVCYVCLGAGGAPIEPEEASITYRCPHCDATIKLSESSDEYLVPCPSCGATVDLTEIEPA